MNFLRTPDPNPGWLNEDDLQEARRRLPMVYVQALPVRLDPLGYLSEIGLLLQATPEGKMMYTFVSGRVLYRETIRAALLRHLEKDLGAMAFPQLPVSTTPFARRTTAECSNNVAPPAAASAASARQRANGSTAASSGTSRPAPNGPSYHSAGHPSARNARNCSRQSRSSEASPASRR